MRISSSFSALALVLALTSACAVGPDFEKPTSPTSVTYTQGGMALNTVGAETEQGGIQRFELGGDVPAAWWTLFKSESLNGLIQKAVTANPSLDAARAALRAAEENAAASYGAFFPAIDGSASDKRTKTTGTAEPFTLYNTGVSVSFVPDVFGGTRREVESMEAKTEAQRFELEATYLTLTSNIVTAAIQEASLRAQIVATKEILESQKKQLDLTKKQFEAGAVAKPAVLAQATIVAATEAGLPALEKALAQTRNQLAVLAGQFPSEYIGAGFDLTTLKLPENIPLSLPSQLVEQRPDIRAALANLKAANADIGVATAAMLPQITLTGSYGVTAGRIADMFTPGTAIWGLAAGLAQPLFHGGELKHKRTASEALFDKAAAQYRSTVLAAFQNVADSLKALESDAETLKAQLAAERAAFENLELTRQQFNAGAVSYVALLTADASYQKAKISLVQAKATRLADTAALFQSLGGGWWTRGPLPASDTKMRSSK